MKFYKIKSNNIIRWCEKESYDDGDIWRNPSGGWCCVRETDEILEECEAEDFADLDWSGTYLDNPNSKCGWIAPDGTFFGCDEEDHDRCAFYVIKKQYREIEQEGYVHISGSGHCYCEEDLTKPQIETMLKMGIKRYIGVPLILGKSWAEARKYFHRDGD